MLSGIKSSESLPKGVFSKPAEEEKMEASRSTRLPRGPASECRLGCLVSPAALPHRNPTREEGRALPRAVQAPRCSGGNTGPLEASQASTKRKDSTKKL